MFKVNNKDTRTTHYFTPCSGVSIANFEHVITGWVSAKELAHRIINTGLKCKS